MTRCRCHPRNATPEELAAIASEMGREGGLAASRAKLTDMPMDLSTLAKQQAVLERVVGSTLNGKLNARAAQAIVGAISISRRLYETVVLEERIQALEQATK
jgi:hypothetical protein